jgi:hypothetical protein
MRAVNRIGLVLGLAALLAACGPPRFGDGELAQLGLGARFGVENLCRGSQSPPIRVDGAPRDVAAYRIRMSNVTVLRQTPREWTIPAPGDPALIPLGALPDWNGPCPGDTQMPRYRIEAMALDASGAAVAYGWTEAVAESVNRLAQEAWRQARGGVTMDPTVPPSATEDPAPLGPDPSRRERDGGFFERDRGTPFGDPLPPGLLTR